MDDMKQTVKIILLKSDLKVSNIKVKPALNYSKKNFLIAAVQLKLPEGENQKILKLIAKRLLNINDERLKLSFIKEEQMYKLVIPEYDKVQEKLKIEQNLITDLFAKFYGSDHCLCNNEENLRTFLIQDIRPDGFVVINPREYLDMTHTRLLVDRLANFHAIGIALKENNPAIFKRDFKDILKPILINENNPNRTEMNLKFRKILNVILNQHEKLMKFSEKVDRLIEIIDEIKIPHPEEPFATLTHNDLWKLNLLFKYNFDKSTKTSTPIDMKFIDFQFCIYNSPIRDLTHFIYSSTQPEVIMDFKNLSHFYYDNFIKYLKLLKCNYNEFTFEKFNDEMKNIGWTKIKHTILLNGVGKKKLRKNKVERLNYIFLSMENNGWFNL